MDHFNSLLFFRVSRRRNERRFYHLYLQPDLFGGVDLMRENGRIGSAGMLRAIHFDFEEDARLEMCRIARRKIGRGYRHIGPLMRAGLPLPAIFENWETGGALDDAVMHVLRNRNADAAALGLHILSRDPESDAHLVPVIDGIMRLSRRLDTRRADHP